MQESNTTNTSTRELTVSERIEMLEKTTDGMKQEVTALRNDTKDIVSAFQAASGAFIALEWLARTVKPILFIGAMVGGFILWVKGARI